MKVLHLIDTGGPGGAETVFAHLVHGMAERGWRGVAAVPYVGWLHGALVERNVEPQVLPRSGALDVGYLRRLRAIARRDGIVLVHAHLLASAVYGSLLGMLGDLPVVCTFHGVPDIPAEGRLLAARLRLIQRPTNRLVFVSSRLEGSLRGHHRLHARLCRVVYNGVPFETPTLTGDERETLGAGPEDLLAVAVGNLRPAKDYGTLLEAAALGIRRGIPLKVAIIGQGDGALRASLESRSAALGLEGSVRFMGFRPDAARFLAAADLFVSSSSSEGFSLSTVEALGLGRPVVATRSGGPEEIVVDGESGWLVPTGDPEAFAEALACVFTDPSEAFRRGAHGREQVRARFSLERMLDDYEHLYRELLSPGSLA